MGWEIWSLWRAFLRRETSGFLEEMIAKTAIPVPPTTARHQLCSVPPTARLWVDMYVVMIAAVVEEWYNNSSGGEWIFYRSLSLCFVSVSNLDIYI